MLSQTLIDLLLENNGTTLNPRHTEYFYVLHIHASLIFIVLTCSIPVASTFVFSTKSGNIVNTDQWPDGFIISQSFGIYSTCTCNTIPNNSL